MRIEIVAVEGLPEIGEGTRIGELVAGAAEIRDGDVVVVSQKIVSKAEGRVRDLGQVEVGPEAARLGDELGKDAALVQVILDESRSVLRAERGVLISETRAGWVCANAGVDASNVPDEGTVTLLPLDADASARALRQEIREAAGVRVAVVVADSFGRAWRLGQVDVAIGVAGLAPVDDWRGRRDRDGRELEATVIGFADEVAAAADLARDKSSGAPVVVVRGLEAYVGTEDGDGAVALQRPGSEDLFR